MSVIRALTCVGMLAWVGCDGGQSTGDAPNEVESAGGTGGVTTGNGGAAPAGTGGSGAPGAGMSATGAGGAGAVPTFAGGASGGTVGNGGTTTTGGTGAGGANNGGTGGGATNAGAGGVTGAGGAGGSAGAGAAGSAGAGGSTGRTPDPKFLVPATGTCPEFKDGYATFTPDGVSRRVLLYAAPKPDLHGPLIFSWHSTLPRPEDAVAWIGQSVINEIKAQGGVVAAPATGNSSATRPWDHTPQGPSGDNDQRLMDEIVACAVSKVGIDVRRIHATGMSAGGLKTAQVSLRRSGYLASVVVFSGGLTAGDQPPDQDPQNPVAAMILYGGPTDISPVDGINYTDASNRYLTLMRGRGSFAFLCNHGGGHSVPTDSQASTWRFMQDHPFGVSPSPYAMKLPNGFLRYCSLP